MGNHDLFDVLASLFNWIRKPSPYLMGWTLGITLVMFVAALIHLLVELILFVLGWSIVSLLFFGYGTIAAVWYYRISKSGGIYKWWEKRPWRRWKKF